MSLTPIFDELIHEWAERFPKPEQPKPKPELSGRGKAAIQRDLDAAKEQAAKDAASARAAAPSPSDGE